MRISNLGKANTKWGIDIDITDKYGIIMIFLNHKFILIDLW